MRRLTVLVAGIGVLALVLIVGIQVGRNSTSSRPASYRHASRQLQSPVTPAGRQRDHKHGPAGHKQEQVRGRSSLQITVWGGGSTVMGAQVSVHHGEQPICRNGMTDQSGRVRFEGLIEGRYELSVAHADFVSHSESFSIIGTQTQLDVYLTEGARVLGVVVDRSNMPVAGAVVRALAKDSNDEFGMDETNARGEFALTGLPITTLRLYVHTGRHRPKFTEPMRFSAPGEAQRVVIQLEDANRVQGRVMAPDGKPLAGAQVGCSDEGSNIVTTRDDGGFELGGIGDEPVNVFVVARGFGPKHVRGVAPNTAGLYIVLEAAARIVGEVVPEAQVEGFEVALWKYDEYFRKDLRVAAHAFESPARHFEFNEIAPGDYVLEIVADGHQPTKIPVHVLAGQTLDQGAVALKRTEFSRGQNHER